MYNNNDGTILSVTVNKNCDGCGVCSALSKCFIDGSEGKAIPINGGILTKMSLDEIKDAESSCPMNAIAHSNCSMVKGEGKVTVQDLKKYVQKNIIEFKYPKPEYSNFTYNDKATIDRCVGDVQSKYEYRSSGAAESAGYDAAKRLVFDRIKRHVSDELIKYKQKTLAPLLRYEETNSNFYYAHNQEVSIMIKSLLFEIESITNKKISNIDHIASINVEPNLGNNSKNYDYVSNIEYYMDNRGQADVESPSWYKCYINTDDMEVYEGKKCVTRYNYNIDELVNTVENHITSGLRSELSDYFNECIVGLQFQTVVKPIEDAIHEKGKMILSLL